MKRTKDTKLDDDKGRSVEDCKDLILDHYLLRLCRTGVTSTCSGLWQAWCFGTDDFVCPRLQENKLLGRLLPRKRQDSCSQA